MRSFLLQVAVCILVLAACRQPQAEFNIEYACLHLSLDPCLAAEEFAERVAERTNGRLQIEIVSLSPSPPQDHKTFSGLKEGTLGMVEIYRGQFPQTGDAAVLGIGDIWGLYDDFETQMKVTANIRENSERLVRQ